MGKKAVSIPPLLEEILQKNPEIGILVDFGHRDLVATVLYPAWGYNHFDEIPLP
jgi:hypothetical protein